MIDLFTILDLKLTFYISFFNFIAQLNGSSTMFVRIVIVLLQCLIYRQFVRHFIYVKAVKIVKTDLINRKHQTMIVSILKN